jgi:hypothetical protein
VIRAGKRAGAPAAPPDPRKHVNYTQGMVLGVDVWWVRFGAEFRCVGSKPIFAER